MFTHGGSEWQCNYCQNDTKTIGRSGWHESGEEHLCSSCGSPIGILHRIRELEKKLAEMVSNVTKGPAKKH